MSTASIIRVASGAVDEVGGKVVLRGVILPESFPNLKTAPYQREALPLSKQKSILAGLTKGESLPDIELGMRGRKFRERNNAIELIDDVFIIDGLQRITAASHYLGQNPDAAFRIGATIYFDTTEEWERERFRILNTERLKVSSNVILRNAVPTNDGVRAIHSLVTRDQAFPLVGRVCWSQNMKRGEIISALTYAKVVLSLHAHKSAYSASSAIDAASSLKQLATKIGVRAMRENTRTYFELIDECWGIKRILHGDSVTYMRGQFLATLAKLLSDHYDFWEQDPEEQKLFVHAPIRRKIAQLPLNDPNVANLASSSGPSRELLYMLIRNHINKGKSTKRLSSRIPEGGIELEEAEAN